MLDGLSRTGRALAGDLTDRVRAVLADRYDVERQAGVGGMATVFRARDLKHGRPIAIKVLLWAGSDRQLQPIAEDARQRAQRLEAGNN